MSERKYTGFAALYELDQEQDRRSGKIGSVVNQKEPLVNTGQPESVNQLTSAVNQLTSEKVFSQQAEPVNQSASVVNQSGPLVNQNEAAYPSRKERKLVGLRLPTEKLELYRMWCRTNKIDLQDAVEMAMDWLTSQGMVNQSPPVNQLTSPDHDDHDHDEDLIDDKLSSVMRFYSQWTGNRATRKDREAYREVAHIDLKVIQSGILLAVYRAFNAKVKINSFKYCLNPILESARPGIGNMDRYIEYLTDQIKKQRT